MERNSFAEKNNQGSGSAHKHFSIRGYVAEMRKKLYPSETLPPMEVPNFRFPGCPDCELEMMSSQNPSVKSSEKEKISSDGNTAVRDEKHNSFEDGENTRIVETDIKEEKIFEHESAEDGHGVHQQTVKAVDLEARRVQCFVSRTRPRAVCPSAARNALRSSAPVRSAKVSISSSGRGEKSKRISLGGGGW